MKKSLVYAITLSFMLTACGSSGGGSDGLAPPNALSAAAIAAEARIFSSSPAHKTANIIEEDGDRNNPYDDYVRVERDDSGILFTYRDIHNNDVLGTTSSMRQFHIATGAADPSNPALSDFAVAGSFQEAQHIDTVAVNSASVQGTYTATNKIKVGGKELGLQYADFGMWTTETEFVGTVNGQAVNRTLMHDPEDWTASLGKHANKADFAAGAANATFTGTAMGVAREYAGVGDDRAGTNFDVFDGTATLNVNVANRSANLALNFNEFYDFTFNNLQIERGGEFEERAGQNVNYDKAAGYASTVDLTGFMVRDFDVDGQFYGPNATTPTEAVGDADMYLRDDLNNKTIEIDMTFGVKRP